MQIITTHIMADFDALACMVAAKKLYPQGILVFPGSQEKKVRDYLKESPFSLELMSSSQIDPADVDLLVVVDTKLKERIGDLAKVVEMGNAKIHVYDHHPAHPKDINAHIEVVDEVGAASTLFVEIFQKKGVKIGVEEATLLALGIYEDTGSFTFNSTTPRDMKAAAYLLEQGADLNQISDYVKRELTTEQVSLLDEMIRNTEIHTIQGIEVAITTISKKKYVGDLAILAHKLKDMENLNVLFVLARMDDRITLIARSRLEAVDVGSIAEEFGGGGHATAASAVIKDLTLIQTKDRLLELLRTKLGMTRGSREIMTAPPLSINPASTIEEAEKTMVRFNINALLVMEREKLLGIITRQTLEKAIYHHLQRAPVREYMTTDFITVSPDVSLEELEEIMMNKGQRIVPVVDKDRVIGVVTRGELLRALYEDLSLKPKPLRDERREPFMKNVKVLMKDRLPTDVWSIIQKAGEIANTLGYNAYLVGGFVRDLLLRVSNLDLDIVVEGDGMVFADELAKALGGRTNKYSKFKTAVVILPDGQKMDVATSRLEFYEEPGALPEVTIGSIKRDLYRRDFSINTMAIKISGPDAFTLIDYFGGQRDLKDKVIRVLHNLSFVEDPTRAFRAVRFEQRYGFRIGGQTERLIKQAVEQGLFHKVSGSRLFSELKQMLSEKEPIKMVKRMDKLGLLPFIHPAIKLTREVKELFARIDEVLAWYELLFMEEKVAPWVIYMAAMLKSLSIQETEELTRRLAVPKRYAQVLMETRQKSHHLARILSKASPDSSNIYRLLKPLAMETLLYTMAYSDRDEVKKAVSLYLTQLRRVKPALSGKDLVALGLEPGDIFSKILDILLTARLKGEVSSREGELRLVKKLLEKELRRSKAQKEQTG
jgi:tRNA nucleotidyltransferase (CCA-adding enzyme)